MSGRWEASVLGVQKGIEHDEGDWSEQSKPRERRKKSGSQARSELRMRRSLSAGDEKR